VRIHLLANVQRPDAVAAARDCVHILVERGVEVAAEADTADALSVIEVGPEAFADCDLAICFGGDGTLIRAAHWCAEKGTPILGVYFGRFGFVTQCKPHEVGVSLSQFFDGKPEYENRMMLQGELIRSGHVVTTLHALNEIALQRDVSTRMLSFRVEVDGRELTSYPADGVLVATPTGSTAYNLSAGGPIVDPRLRAMILTAMQPHTLSARPLVLGPESTVMLTVTTVGDAVLSADSQIRLHMLSGDALRVTQSPRVTRLFCVDSHDFLVKLGERLFWSQSLVGNWQP